MNNRRNQEATAVIKIWGMSDPGRAQHLRQAAGKLDGVLRVDFNYILDSVTVKYDADKLTSAQVKKKLGLGNPRSQSTPENTRGPV